MPNPDEKKEEKRDERQEERDERQEEQGKPEDETAEGQDPDPMGVMTQMLADLRAEIASFKEDMAEIHATLGAMANQQALSDSLDAEDEAGDDKPSDDEQYPSFDLDDFARTIGDY